MDRNTIIAIILSVIVITVGMTVQTVFFPMENSIVETETTTEETISVESVNSIITEPVVSKNQVTDTSPFTIETDALTVTFDPYGASVSSIKMKKHLDTSKQPVEILLKDGNSGNAFLMYQSNDTTNPITEAFSHSIEERDHLILVIFSQVFEQNGREYEIIKKYAFAKNEEYLFQIAVSLNSLDGKELPFTVYTIGVEPQVGPEFESLNGNYDYRRMYYKLSDKSGKKNVSFKNGVATVNEDISWAALASKYFTIIGIPASGADYSIKFTQNNEGKQENSFFLTRNGISSSSVTDVYSFYCGPKLTSYLNKYDIANDNTFKITNLNLAKVMDTSTWLGWLETVLKWVLTLIYKFIPNYGVAIIILTLLIKLMLQPISKKGMESTAKMSALNPKLEELKAKYADDPNALNAAMAKLYKEEGINPMGSCLPMLIQFPVFIALYGLLNNHFELRGAMFIPGWIPDLSIPDTVFTLGFNLPLIGNQIHLLPIIYTVSMIFSMKITQTGTTDASQAGMMKFMTYGMPLIFFFVLYNAPSGLLVYWTVTNAISIIQQVYVNSKKKKQFEAEMIERNTSKNVKFKGKKRK